MKAIVYHNYGSPDGLKLEEVAKPAPREDEVLVEIHAATVTPGDGFVVKAETCQFDIRESRRRT